MIRLPRITLGAAEMEDRLGFAIVALSFGLAGLKFGAIFAIGNRLIEPADLGALATLGIFATLLSMRQFKVRVPLIWWAHALFVTLLIAGYLVHGTPEGVSSIARVGFNLMCALAILNIAYFDFNILLRAAKFGMVAAIAYLAYSATVAGVDLLDALTKYFLTLDRSHLRRILFAIFNSATTGGLDELVRYSGTVINVLSASLGAFLSVFLASIFAGDRRPTTLVAAVVSATLVVTLFSSSAMAVLAMTLLASGAALMLSANTRIYAGLFGAVFVGFLALQVSGGGAYIAAQVAQDDGSRGERLEQYAVAAESIDRSILWGEGLVLVDDATIHNLFLSSWATSGILAAVFVMCLYIYMFRMMSYGFARMVQSRLADPVGLVLVAFSAQYLLRTSIGGGGGLPGTVELYPIAAAILLFHRALAEDAAARPSMVRRSVVPRPA